MLCTPGTTARLHGTNTWVGREHHHASPFGAEEASKVLTLLAHFKLVYNFKRLPSICIACYWTRVCSVEVYKCH
jgi:hypothetical protein